MKPAAALLTVSVVANFALAALYFTRSPRPATRIQPSTPSRPAAASTSIATSRDALRAALAAGDVAALEAAGLSPEAARELLLGRAFFRAFERVRAAQASQPADDRWWRTSRRNSSAARELSLQNRREISDALVAAFGDDLGLFSGGDGSTQLGFLPAEKRDALRRITQDYDEMMAKFSAGGLQLPSDRERLKLLRAERDRDIAALLTPAEREAYEMRTSQTAQNVRARYGDGIETEDDFRKIYAMQKAFDEKFPLDGAMGRISPETMRERGEAQRQLQDNIRAALGDDKYAALRRASDPDLRTVDSLVSRLNLPPATTDRIATSRETFAAESQRINANAALTPQQRRTQIQDLASRAKTELTQTLGGEAGDAYAQRSPWVSMLQNGMAFTTTPPTNMPMLAGVPSVHPVMPPGGTGPGAQQQTFTIATPVAAGDARPVDFHGGSGGSNVRVMTFSTGDAVKSGAPGGGQNMIFVPKAPAEPTP